MKYFLSICLLIFINNFSFSQNIFLNGDFEIYNKNEPFLINDSINLYGVTQPSQAFPVFFNSTKSGNKNFNAALGNCMMVCGMIKETKSKFYEEKYFGLLLKKPLLKDSLYLLSFDYRQPILSNASINMQLAFSDSVIYIATQQNIVIPNSILFPTINCLPGFWYRFDYLYKAKGGEQVLYVGNFQSDSIIQIKYWREQKDTFCLFQCDDFELNKSGGDSSKRLLSIYFDTDSYTLTKSESKRLLDFVQQLKGSKFNTIYIQSYSDSTGTENRNYQLRTKRKQTVINFLSVHGIKYNQKLKSIELIDDKMKMINERRADIFVELK